MRVRLMRALRFFCLAGLTLGGRFRFPRDGPMAGAAVAVRAAASRDRMESQCARLCVGSAAHAPAGNLSRRRERRARGLSAPHHRCEKRTDPGALSRPGPKSGGPRSPPGATRSAEPRPPGWAGRGTGNSPTRRDPRGRRNRPTARRTSIFRRLSARTTPGRPRPPKPKSASTTHGPRATKPAAPTMNPPLPPPAPRETAKADGSGPAAPGSSAEARDRPKVTIVPPALFE